MADIIADLKKSNNPDDGFLEKIAAGPGKRGRPSTSQVSIPPMINTANESSIYQADEIMSMTNPAEGLDEGEIRHRNRLIARLKEWEVSRWKDLLAPSFQSRPALTSMTTEELERLRDECELLVANRGQMRANQAIFFGGAHLFERVLVKSGAKCNGLAAALANDAEVAALLDEMYLCGDIDTRIAPHKRLMLACIGTALAMDSAGRAREAASAAGAAGASAQPPPAPTTTGAAKPVPPNDLTKFSDI